MLPATSFELLRWPMTMGLDIDRDRFASTDYARFDERLENCLLALETLLGRPGFGEGPTSIGAELEVALIDHSARPLPLNIEVLQETLDPRMTVELDRFNLECNLRYGALAGAPFAALRAEFEDAYAELSRAAERHAARVAMIGILPTIRAENLESDAMTDTTRYRALAFALRNARNAPFRLDIDGDDPLTMECDGVTFEGAATSLQVHLRVEPKNFAALFNALQLATAPVLALAGNSPVFIGHRLWQETRIALFKQAVDERNVREKQDQRLPRVGFGTGWLREGALELFREAVEVFPALLPILYEEDPAVCLEAGEIPSLKEIRLHQGTVWSWNRPVYDPTDGGHLRIELRALPSGPTITDMLANTAFMVGLGYGLLPEIDELTERLDFEDAHANFYRAAKSGLDAELVWPDGAAGVCAPGDRIRSAELALQLVDVAHRGLRAQAVEAADADPLLQVITERADGGQTGAVWQRRMLERLESGRPSEASLAQLMEHYVVLSSEGNPVHLWPVER
jgi:gamma-glutamyl:cysteine ligase YbdK (ATP-grasp superfamily)